MMKKTHLKTFGFSTRRVRALLHIYYHTYAIREMVYDGAAFDWFFFSLFRVKEWAEQAQIQIQIQFPSIFNTLSIDWQRAGAWRD